MLKRGAGLILVAAGAALLATSVILFLAVTRTGTDWSGRFLVQAAAVLGMVLISIGAALFRGLPTGAPERRPTSLLVVLLALTLFVPMLAVAVLLFLASFRASASIGLRLGASAFLLLSFAGVVALLRDAFRRRGDGRAERAGSGSSGGGGRAAPARPQWVSPRRLELGKVLFVRRHSRIMGAAIATLSLVLLVSAITLLRSRAAPTGSDQATALFLALVGVVLGLVAWRSLRAVLRFHEHGVHARTFFSSFSALYEELSEVSTEELVMEHGQRTVVITFHAHGRPRRLLLDGRIGLDLGERRDPDAQAIVGLVTGAGSGAHLRHRPASTKL